MGQVDAESCTKDLYEATKKIASEFDAASVASKFCTERLDDSIFPTWVAVFGLFVTLIGLLVAYGPSFLHPLTPASIQKPHVRGRVIIGHGCEVVGVLLSAWGIAQLGNDLMMLVIGVVLLAALMAVVFWALVASWQTRPDHKPLPTKAHPTGRNNDK